MLTIKFDATQKGKRIENIPQTGTQTGRYFTDYSGCWWELTGDDNKKSVWIIGEYPQQ